MKSLTYGVLPTQEEFDAAFDSACPSGYRISLSTSDSRAVDGFKLGVGKWSASELWEAINEIVNTAAGDEITVSEDDEFEDVYQIFYPGTDRPYVTIGPDDEELIEWANRFSNDPIAALTPTNAIACLNFAAAYGQAGEDWTRHDERMDLVSGILETLGFEWI